MALDGKELESMADDILRDRRIRGSLYCGNCGYNLKTLPRKYVCPECGHPYSTRAPMRGIFFPHDSEPPLGSVAGILGCGTVAAILITDGVATGNQGEWILGAIFAALTLGFVIRAWIRLKRFLKFREIARRIAVQEED